jgi:hypothetical protein
LAARDFETVQHKKGKGSGRPSRAQTPFDVQIGVRIKFHPQAGELADGQMTLGIPEGTMAGQ